MNNQVRAQRHEHFWQAGSASLKRMAIGGLIFAVIILVKVISPYGKQAVLQPQLTTVVSQIESVQRELKKISVVKRELDEIKSVIESKQLEQAKDELQQFFREGANGDPQTRANETLEQIRLKINELIVTPLNQVIEQQVPEGELANIPAKFDKTVDDWINSKVDTDWYRTVGSKGDAVSEVQNMLTELNQEAGLLTLNMIEAAESKQQELTQSIAAQKQEVETLQGQIESAMSQALPSWAGKLISAPMLVMIYPWILVIIAAYMLIKGMITARHYKGMADANAWTLKDRSDPLMSNIWTLTYRGKLGTVLTQLTYGGILLALWYCFYLSQQYAQVESIIKMLEVNDTPGTDGLSDVPRWLGHAAIAAIMGAIFYLPISGVIRGEKS